MIRGLSCRLIAFAVLKALKQITTDKRHWQKNPPIQLIPFRYHLSGLNSLGPA